MSASLDGGNTNRSTAGAKAFSLAVTVVKQNCFIF